MAHSITCQCGKRLLAGKPVEGRRIRCPGCGGVVGASSPKIAIPATAPAADVAPAVPPLPVARAVPAARPAPPPGPAVFVSHSAKDSVAAAAICSALEGDGIRCWIAPRDIVPGTEWSEAIIDGISSCRIMILIFSGHSNQSPQVRREVERAVNKGLVLVPFRIEDVPMAKSLEYFLSSPHWLDALTQPLDPHIRKLAATVRVLLRDEPAKPAEKKVDPPRPSKAAPRHRLTRWLALGLAGGGVCGSLLLVAALVLLLNHASARTAQPNEGDPPPAVAEPAKPGNPRANLSPSEVALRDGTLHVRSLRVETNPASPAVPPGEKADPPRWVVVSNQADVARWGDPGSKARVHFQVTNDSYEGVTLAKVELALLGVVDLYEDRIPEPRPPLVAAAVPPREVKFGRSQPLADVADAAKVFQDPNDPPSPLRYEVTSDQPDVAQPTLDPQNRVQIFLPGTKGGTASITLRGTNAFDLAAATSFSVKSEPRPPRVVKPIPPREITIASPQTLTNVADVKTLFDDALNDPPTALRYEVTSDLPDVANPTIDFLNQLQIALPGTQGGTATITVRAINAYNLAEVVRFPVTVRVKATLVANAVPAQVSPLALQPVQQPSRQLPAPVNGNANPTLGIGNFEVEKETLRLTNVQFAHAVKRNAVVRPCTSGNLLPDDADSFLKPNTGRKVAVDVACPSTWELPAQLPKDLLAGTRQRQLAASSPQFLGTCHLMVVLVEVIGEDGTRREVYGDRVYAFYSQALSELPGGDPTRAVVATHFDRGEDKDLDPGLTALLKWGLKPTGETVAYQRAKLCGVALDRLDPLGVDPVCYYGDRDSAYRSPGTPVPGAADAWPRTNLVRVLAQARSAHPKLANLFNDSLTRLTASPDPAVAHRATFVTTGTRTLPPTAAAPVESLPPRRAAANK